MSYIHPDRNNEQPRPCNRPVWRAPNSSVPVPESQSARVCGRFAFPGAR